MFICKILQWKYFWAYLMLNLLNHLKRLNTPTHHGRTHSLLLNILTSVGRMTVYTTSIKRPILTIVYPLVSMFLGALDQSGRLEFVGIDWTQKSKHLFLCIDLLMNAELPL